MDVAAWIEKLRWWFAILFVISFPPAVLYWFALHPFVGFWRRLGSKITFTVLGVSYLGLMAALFPFRVAMTGRDFGGNLTMFLLGLPFIVVAMIIQRARKKYLKFRILAGVPEIADGGQGSILLNEGIYAKIRHPRYAEFIVGSIGWALWLNYLGVWVIIAAAIAGVLAIIPMEERELRERFGDAYVQYAARVPRFIPRR